MKVSRTYEKEGFIPIAFHVIAESEKDLEEMFTEIGQTSGDRLYKLYKLIEKEVAKLKKEG